MLEGNFDGLAAWERRSYFDEKGTIVYAESRGAEAFPPGQDARRLVRQAEWEETIDPKRFRGMLTRLAGAAWVTAALTVATVVVAARRVP